MTLTAPMPWFGGKRRVAPTVWQRFGKVRNYVEPFFGSGAVLLARPTPFDGVETVNDADGLLANFWRAVKADPLAVADHADWPVNENDLHARHAWLVGQKDSLQARMEGDPDFFDAKIAGWWVWGMACWIGSGFCSGHGPWQVVEAEDGSRQLVHLGNAGQGVNRKRVHLNAGQGVNRQRDNHRDCLMSYMAELSDRLRHVRVCCGDWTRVMGETPTEVFAPSAIFLDPPYADTADRRSDIYRVDCEQVAHAVREWAIANGGNKNLRICLAGYEGEHDMPDDWECVEGKAGGERKRLRRSVEKRLREQRAGAFVVLSALPERHAAFRGIRMILRVRIVRRARQKAVQLVLSDWSIQWFPRSVLVAGDTLRGGERDFDVRVADWFQREESRNRRDCPCVSSRT